MSSLNKVTLIGNLGKDPEVKSFQNGGKVCNFSVATSDRWKDKQTGEMKERVQWHAVAVFDENLADVCERFLVKGSKVYLEGQLETRKWTSQDGAERYATEVVMRPFNSKLVMLTPKADASQADARVASTRRAVAAAAHPARSIISQKKSKYDDLNDEIPF